MPRNKPTSEEPARPTEAYYPGVPTPPISQAEHEWQLAHNPLYVPGCVEVVGPPQGEPEVEPAGEKE